MIPALTGPAIRHRPEQFQQVSANLGDRGRPNSRSGRAIGNGNGRLDHVGAPVGREEFVRELLVLPELCHVMPPDTPQRDLIATSRRKPPSRSPAALNDLETAVRPTPAMHADVTSVGSRQLARTITLAQASWPEPPELVRPAPEPTYSRIDPRAAVRSR